MASGGQDARARLKQGKNGPLVLLFYDGFELLARPGMAGFAHSQARRIARWAWRSARGVQVHTGFYAAFLALRRSLRAVGCDVRVNDFALARSMPDYPVGIAGYPSVIDRVRLPNPMIFGPGDYGPPQAGPNLLRSTNIRIYIQPSDWYRDYYEPHFGGRTQTLFVGIDAQRWPDWSGEPKDNDVLVYDKIRWGRDTLVPEVRERLIEHLERRGLSHHTLVYGNHHYWSFAHWLRRSRVMVFLCEHETQGLAYQEAMSTNMPVYAWDEGRLIDPQMMKRPELNASSVPYFDKRCGATFRLAEMETGFDRFWAERATFEPRAYVLDALSEERCGERYLSMYASLT